MIDVTPEDYVAFVKWASSQTELERDVMLFCEPPMETFVDANWRHPEDYVARARLEDRPLPVPAGANRFVRVKCAVRDDWHKRWKEVL